MSHTFNGKFTVTPIMSVATVQKILDFADVSHEKEPKSPGYWCQWIPSGDSSIEWDGNEKFRDADKWLAYLIKKVLKPAGHTVNGAVHYWGDDGPDDAGIIMAEDNAVRVRLGKIVYED